MADPVTDLSVKLKAAMDKLPAVASQLTNLKANQINQAALNALGAQIEQLSLSLDQLLKA